MIPPAGFIDGILLSLAKASVGAAQNAVLALLGALGKATEPDFQSLAPTYDRMLAMALLLVVFFASCAVVEHQLGGSQGAGVSTIPRTLIACFAAFTGLPLLGYLESYAALLATAWTPDFLGQNAHLDQVVNNLYNSYQLTAPALGSIFGLLMTAVLTVLLAIFVYVELVLRAALILITATFLPLVATMWIWPRLAGAASHMAQFLVGLLLSKFVIATAVYVGYSIVIKGLVENPASSGMVVGLATLAVAALSPVVLLQGIHFGQQAAAPLARGWSASGYQALSSAGQRLKGPASRLLDAGRRRLPDRLAFLRPKAKEVEGAS